MKRNVGTADRIIRAVLGIAAIGAGVYFGSWWGAIGIVLLFTAAIGWCPAYLPFGLNSCVVKQ
ncbi:MAG TPA: DUF2892 domain-containing protein [Bacteroidota bacterium]|nr:DUF2892 domain-containing protein [Bacteroidota bacterium]